MKDENDFRRGYGYALDAVDEAMDTVRWALMDDAGKHGELTTAVLGAVSLALRQVRHAHEDTEG